MDVLDVGFYAEMSGINVGKDIFESGKEYGEFFGGKESDAAEHLDVGHGTHHVVTGKAVVEHAVTSYGEGIDAFGGTCAFVPES